MINSVDTPKLIYPVTILEIVSKMINMDDTEPVIHQTKLKKDQL